MQTDIVGWISIIASVITIISLTINIFQWHSSVNLRKQYYSHLFSEWNLMYRIAELADGSRGTYDSLEQSESIKLNLIIRNIEQITGIADSSRQASLAFSEKYFKKPIYRQHPAAPDPKVH